MYGLWVLPDVVRRVSKEEAESIIKGKMLAFSGSLHGKGILAPHGLGVHGLGPATARHLIAPHRRSGEGLQAAWADEQARLDGEVGQRKKRSRRVGGGGGGGGGEGGSVSPAAAELGSEELTDGGGEGRGGGGGRSGRPSGAEEEEEEEEEEEGSVLAGAGSGRHGRGRVIGPRIFWQPEEDRILFRAMARYRIEHGPPISVRWVQTNTHPSMHPDKTNAIRPHTLFHPAICPHYFHTRLTCLPTTNLMS